MLFAVLNRQVLVITGDLSMGNPEGVKNTQQLSGLFHGISKQKLLWRFLSVYIPQTTACCCISKTSIETDFVPHAEDRNTSKILLNYLMLQNCIMKWKMCSTLPGIGGGVESFLVSGQ